MGLLLLLPEASVEQVWAAGAPRVDVLIGATAEETWCFAVIDPTFNWLGCLPLPGTGLARLLVRLSSHLIYQEPAR